tara:strand:- start:124 stop:417 length:294 start_codon:yes stop_codon:yes gene_type:complete
MEQWFLDNAFSLVATIFGGGSFYAFITEKKKRRIELKSTQADALSSMQETYDKFVDDFTNKYDHLQKEIEQLKKELDSWKSKYQNLKREFDKKQNLR